MCEIFAQIAATTFVIPNRILMALLQPLLALLLMAGAAQAGPCPIVEEREWVLTGSYEVVSTWDQRTDKGSLAVQPPSASDDDQGTGFALPVPKQALILDVARLVRNSLAAYPTAPPAYRPCAAPPTGPPLV